MKIDPAAAISGHFAVPGDKSISHRAVLLSAVGEGETRITGFGRSADTESTIAAVRALGAERINIADFDLQHLSSERGGTLAILVAGEEEAARAAAILEQQGYGVVVAAVLDEDPE